MTRPLMLCAAGILWATTATANDTYSLEVTSDGVLYNCQPDIEIIDGVRSRRCIRADRPFDGGLGGAGAAALGLVALAVVVSAGDDDDEPTTGTE